MCLDKNNEKKKRVLYRSIVVERHVAGTLQDDNVNRKT